MRLELSIRETIGHSITQDRGSELPQGEAATRGTFLCKAHRKIDLRRSRDLVEPIVRPRVYMRARIDSSTGHVGDPRLPPLHTFFNQVLNIWYFSEPRVGGRRQGNAR
jgi:hypothetical protein